MANKNYTFSVFEQQSAPHVYSS